MNPEQRWPITPEDRAKAVAVALSILEKGTPMEQIEAAGVLVEMESQNQAAASASTKPSWLGPASTN